MVYLQSYLIVCWSYYNSSHASWLEEDCIKISAMLTRAHRIPAHCYDTALLIITMIIWYSYCDSLRNYYNIGMSFIEVEQYFFIGPSWPIIHVIHKSTSLEDPQVVIMWDVKLISPFHFISLWDNITIFFIYSVFWNYSVWYCLKQKMFDIQQIGNVCLYR